jgi:cyclin H
VTDAYFHYTPSQIMLAALALADRELAQRIIDESFRDSRSQTNGHGQAQGEDGAAAELLRRLADETRQKVVSTVKSCRDMLATEPPERMSDFWGGVGFLLGSISPVLHSNALR